MSTDTATFTVPGMEDADASSVRDVLTERLIALLDLSLTLKHIHWNVVGENFIAVHEMLDPQYTAAAQMVDRVAERIATLGGEPNGLAGNLVAARKWDDYPLHRALVADHLSALDQAYAGLIAGHRRAIDSLENDLVSQDMLIGQTGELEQFQWFVRAHLEDARGRVQQT